MISTKPHNGIGIVTFGIAALLVKLFSYEMRPLIEALYFEFFEFIENSPPSVWFWVFPLAAYIPAVFIALLFVDVAGLRARLPENIPGKILISIGLFLIVISWLARIFLFVIASENNGPFGFYMRLPALAIYLARYLTHPYLHPLGHIFIVIGVARTLLAAAPRQLDGPPDPPSPSNPSSLSDLSNPSNPSSPPSSNPILWDA